MAPIGDFHGLRAKDLSYIWSLCLRFPRLAIKWCRGNSCAVASATATS
jgi:hypothetical protein